MDYHGALPTLEAEQICDAVLLALKSNGHWSQLSPSAIAEHLVELERFVDLPTIQNAQLLDSHRLNGMTLSIINWRTRWQHHSRYQPHEYDSFSVHLLLHIYPTAITDHLMLRPETIADKINEWFKRVELDFPGDRVFSRQHYVLAEDVPSAERLLTQEIRTSLNEIPNITMESRGGATLLAPLGAAQPDLIEPLLKTGRMLAETA